MGAGTARTPGWAVMIGRLVFARARGDVDALGVGAIEGAEQDVSAAGELKSALEDQELHELKQPTKGTRGPTARASGAATRWEKSARRPHGRSERCASAQRRSRAPGLDAPEAPARGSPAASPASYRVPATRYTIPTGSTLRRTTS
jgi:hypothetical protein